MRSPGWGHPGAQGPGEGGEGKEQETTRLSTENPPHLASEPGFSLVPSPQPSFKGHIEAPTKIGKILNFRLLEQ